MKTLLALAIAVFPASAFAGNFDGFSDEWLIQEYWEANEACRSTHDDFIGELVACVQRDDVYVELEERFYIFFPGRGWFETDI